MAIVKPGQVGDFNGKIGQVVLTKWRDVNVGRSAPKKSTKPPTLARLDQQSKFGLVTGFLGSIADLLAIGYQSSGSPKLTPMNAAVRYHLSNAVTGVYPDYQMDYTKVVISNANVKGEIDGGYTVSATAVADAKVTVTWLASSADALANKLTSPADQLYLVFYNITKQRFVTFESKGTRAALTTTVQIPRSFVGNKIHAYMFFVSPDGKSVSVTEQLGSFTLLA